MPRTRGARTDSRSRRCALAALLAAAGLAAAAPAHALPEGTVRVGDPLEAELRVLDLFDAASLGDHLLLPHLGTRPLLVREVVGPGTPPAALDRVRAISVERLERALQRDAPAGWATGARSTPRLFAWEAPSGERLELSAGLDGLFDAARGDTRVLPGSGARFKLAARVDRWVAYSDVLVGKVQEARRFADPIVAGTDVIVHTEDTWLGWVPADAHWSVRLGRSRWHWGPGEEGSLTLSRTSAAYTALVLDADVPALHLHGSALSATLDQAAGEQLAAHRVEWQPIGRLRVGATETARYQGSGWQPLYGIGVLPYIVVQRLLLQDEPDSLARLRNNIMVSFDASLRIAEGSRVYGEWLVDDLHARSGRFPNKYAWQVGWEGAGSALGQRLTWGGEYTRLSRFVYTSYFGRSYVAQGRPLGFPTGPDSRRVRVRATWDPDADWQVVARAARTDRGESGLDTPYLPGTPVPPVGRLQGVVEVTRDLEGGFRWWPASGVDVTLLGGWRWVRNPDHVAGAASSGARGSLEIGLAR